MYVKYVYVFGHVSGYNSPLVLNVCKFLETPRKGTAVSLHCLRPFDCSVNTMRLEIPAFYRNSFCNDNDESTLGDPFSDLWFESIFKCTRGEVLTSAAQLQLQSESCTYVTLKCLLLLGWSIEEKLHSKEPSLTCQGVVTAEHFVVAILGWI